MYRSKPTFASLFHPYLCMANLTFRATRIDYDIAGAYRAMSAANSAGWISFLEMDIVSPGSRRAPSNLCFQCPYERSNPVSLLLANLVPTLPIFAWPM